MTIGRLIKDWRKLNHVGLREAGRLIGIDKSTLMRIENGEAMDGYNLAKILTWMLSEAK